MLFRSKRPLAWPGLPRIKLWRDAAENFGHQSMELERVIDGKDKFNVPLRRPVANRPIPLAGFYVLSDWVPGQPETITRLTGSTAMQAAMSNTYRKNYLSKMKLMRENFLQAAILTRRIGIFSAPRRRGFDIFAQEAGKLEKHFRETLFSTIEGSDPVRSNNKLGVSLV